MTYNEAWGNSGGSRLAIGSLFDGSGTAPLAATMCGIEPVWCSEVEPFCIAVTRARFPKMKHYGNICTIKGDEIEPVDIICGGSPCQDLSAAGKRAGLDGGERSVLFREQIRIIKEMRNADKLRIERLRNAEIRDREDAHIEGGKAGMRGDNGADKSIRPRFAIWENVPGAFSSNGGEDFRCVLEAFCQIADENADIPRPKKWAAAGCIVGDGWSVAYRTLDAQHWGVPQRRRRIFLVADFRSERAGEILFESEGMSGYSAESFRSWQGAAADAGEGFGETGIFCLNDQGGQRMDLTEDVTNTLRAESHHPPLVFENHSQDSRYSGPLDVAQTVLSTFGTGGNNQPFVVETPKTLKIRSGCEGGGKGALIQDDKSATLGCNNDQTLFVPTAFGICSKESNAMKSDNPHSGFYKADTSRTLDGNGGNPTCNQGGIAVVEGIPFTQNQRDEVRILGDKSGALCRAATKQQTYVLQGSMIGRKDKNGPQGNGVDEDVSFTLNTIDRHAIAYAMTTGSFTQVTEEKSPTLMSRDYKDPPLVNQPDYIVRRLTPTECARLQGFPDYWCSGLGTENPTEEDISFWTEVWETHRKINGVSKKPKSRKQIIKWLQNPHSDAAEYKMWGNGMALPCVLYIMQGLREAGEPAGILQA